MKYNELQVGINYGVIPSWDYSSQDKKNPERVRRQDLANAKLVSLDKYEYKVARDSRPDSLYFKSAPKGSRVVGYLVVSDFDSTQQPTYWLARPQDIVAPYDKLSERWEREEKEREEIARQQREESERRERLANEQKERELRILNGVKESFTHLLGAERASRIRFDLENKRNAEGEYVPTGFITFDTRTGQLLVEKYLELQDEVN